MLRDGPGVASGSCGDCLVGVSLVDLSRVRLTPPGVKVGLKDTERFPDTDAATGTTSFCTGGRAGSIRFFFAWRCETSRFLPSTDGERGEAAAGILLASASGLDMRSKDCRMRLAVALVTPQG